MELTTEFQRVNEISVYSGSYLQVWAKYTTQSIANNQSTVVAELRLFNDPLTGYNCYDHSCCFTGGVLSDSDYKGSYYHGWGAGQHLLLSQTKTITHNADGTLSFNLGGYFTCSNGIGGTVSAKVVSLPKIDRVSSVSIDKPNFNIGDTINATITQYIGTYHQDLYMVINGNETLIQSGATGTIEIDTSLLANTLYQAIPSAKYLDGTFKVYTYDSNDTLVGTSTTNYRANVVNSNPTYDVAYQDSNATTTAVTQNNKQIIQNKSIFQINISNATAQHYATLSTYKIEINGIVTTGSISSATKNVNIGTINTSNNTTATITITDSRGFTTVKTLNVTILEWKKPTAIVTCNRKQNYYTETDITADATFSSLDNKNTLSIKYRIKKSSVQTWGNWNNLTDNVTTTFNADNTFGWDIQVKVEDAFDSSTYDTSIGIGIPIIFFDRLKRSFGLNCFPQNNDSVEINGVDLFNYIDEFHEYSTSQEIPIGKWIDGKTIYRKVFNVGAIASNTVTINHGISNLDWVINMYGSAKTGGSWYNLDRVSATASNQQVALVVSSTQLFVTAGTDANFSQGCYVVLEYTKSS